jgi:hypothetical protein
MDARISKIQNCLNNNDSIPDISKKLNIKRTTIYSICKKNSIHIPHKIAGRPLYSYDTKQRYRSGKDIKNPGKPIKGGFISPDKLILENTESCVSISVNNDDKLILENTESCVSISVNNDDKLKKYKKIIDEI